jgi:tRNA threonylcarbamoyladenosine biosynthesis protein TsaB
MTVLGIETATSVCSAAVVRDAHVVSERTLDERNIHAEKILSLIDEALSAAGCAVTEVDGIAVSIGPGSFTGLRIGLSVAKGLTYSLGKPLLAVPTLRALAQRAVDLGEVRSSQYIFSLLDARRDEVYCQGFTMDGLKLSPLWPERDMTIADLLESIRGREVVVTGDAHEKLISGLTARGREGYERMTFVHDAASKCSAATVARLGESMLAVEQWSDPASLEPLYIKDFYSKQPSAVHNP